MITRMNKPDSPYFIIGSLTIGGRSWWRSRFEALKIRVRPIRRFYEVHLSNLKRVEVWTVNQRSNQRSKSEAITSDSVNISSLPQKLQCELCTLNAKTLRGFSVNSNHRKLLTIFVMPDIPIWTIELTRRLSCTWKNRLKFVARILKGIEARGIRRMVVNSAAKKSAQKVLHDMYRAVVMKD